ncbi:MAG: hypothetical protein WBV95_13900 [Desulfobacterales bacterium]
MPERKRAGGDEQKICTFGYTNTTHWNEDFRYAPALILFQKCAIFCKFKEIVGVVRRITTVRRTSDSVDLSHHKRD